ncbi:MAG: hypothetical protein Q8N18_12195 [Opitutaceae bacterium]|nr:hypothetical protein [Opitutaceae bacterium]
MFRPILAALALTSSAIAADAPSLHGKIEGKTYHAPYGLFKVAVPVLPELGGEVTDTPNVVTFQDDFNTHVSIAAFPQDATQRWELSTRGLKDYLIYFFSNFVLSDFKQNFEGVQIESAKFLPSAQEGSLLTYLLVPGGSMFGDRIPRIFLEREPVAKRGNLLFVRNGHIFVISTELAERAIEGKSYDKKTEEEDELLRNRLLDILSKMTFAKAPAADAAKK